MTYLFIGVLSYIIPKLLSKTEPQEKVVKGNLINGSGFSKLMVRVVRSFEQKMSHRKVFKGHCRSHYGSGIIIAKL